MSNPASQAPRLTSLQRRLLLELAHARALVEDAATRCPPTDAAAAALWAETRAQLDAWETTVRTPPRPLDFGRDRAALARLSRRRMYLLTPVEMACESRTGLRQMCEQGVPGRVLRDLEEVYEAEVLPAASGHGELDLARAAAARLMEAHDVWGVFAERHVGYSRLAGMLLSVTSVISVCLAALLLNHHVLLPGFLLGGVAGATVSIASRLPPFDTIGSLHSMSMRLVGRFTLGLAACVVGLGLLASGMITLPLGGVPLPEVIASCSGASGPEGCTTPALLALLSVGILLGFSERALASFESTVLGQLNGGAVPPKADQKAQEAVGKTAGTEATSPEAKE